MVEAAATTETRKTPGDDLVLPFRTESSGVIGRLVRLGPAIDEILSHHAAPEEAVSRALGEAVALTAMLGTALKIDGKLTLQTKTDGILDFLVVSFEPPGRLRGYARFDKKRMAEEGRRRRPRYPSWRRPPRHHHRIPARKWIAIRASLHSKARASAMPR